MRFVFLCKIPEMLPRFGQSFSNEQLSDSKSNGFHTLPIMKRVCPKLRYCKIQVSPHYNSNFGVYWYNYHISGESKGLKTLPRSLHFWKPRLGYLLQQHPSIRRALIQCWGLVFVAPFATPFVAVMQQKGCKGQKSLPRQSLAAGLRLNHIAFRECVPNMI